MAMAGSSVTIEDAEFRDNGGELGTVVLSNASNLTVRNSTFSDNRVNNSEHGGGVFLIQVYSAICSSPKRTNPFMMQSVEAPTAVAIAGESRFIRNEATNGDGGVIHVSGAGASLTLEGDAVFKSNVAGRRGGAIFVSEANLVTIRDAAFVDNEAEGTGGGALFAEASPDARN